MKKMLVFISIFFISNSVVAEWTLMGEGENGVNRFSQYVDLATIRKSGNIVKMWSLTDHKFSQKLSSNVKYLSYTSHNEYDCQEELFRINYVLFYDGKMGNGQLVGTFSNHDEKLSGEIINPDNGNMRYGQNDNIFLPFFRWTPIPPREGPIKSFWSVTCGEFAKADLPIDLIQDKKAARQMKSLAEKGDVKAQFILGQLYEEGRGVQKDISEAIKWYSLAAKQGYSLAQAQLGFLYMIGESVPQNFKIGLNYLLLAAEQIEPKAMAVLGAVYALGIGVSTDHIRAYMWFNLFMMFSSRAEEFQLTQDQIKKSWELREGLAAVMSRDQIDKAQDLSYQCLNKFLKNC